MAGEMDGGLVSTAWLADELGAQDLRLYDVTVHLRPTDKGPYRIESGRQDYLDAHIPGAAFIDLQETLSDRSSRFSFTLPALDQLKAGFEAAGIGPGVRVVLYAANSPMWATRVWWMLRSAGFGPVAVLDGGLSKWRAEGRPVEGGERRYAPAAGLDLTPAPGAWASKDDVLKSIGEASVCTINALAPSMHSGADGPRYGRKGRIKGSLNVPFASLLQEDGSFRDPEALRALFDEVGAMKAARVICYCGGGISATMDAMALTRAGHPNVSVYDGSMAEWCADPDLPMESDV